MPPKKPIFKKASERIRLDIESSIRCGRLLPGDPVGEFALARQFGVSRTPVREALLLLKAQGLLSSLPRGGMIVAKMDLQQLLSLWELLAEMEAIAVRLACERMTTEEIQLLCEVHKQSQTFAANEDIVAWQEANTQFHEIIYKGARNPYVRQEALRLRAQIGAYRRHAFGALGRTQASYEQHGVIVEMMQKRDAQGASLAMIRHLRPAQDAASLNNLILNIPREMLAS